MPLIESANAPANSDDVFIRFMCFLPGYFDAGRFADLALPKVPVERDNAPIRCQGEHDMPSQSDGYRGRSPPSTQGALILVGREVVWSPARDRMGFVSS
jgi:hypothetical protein